MRYRKLAEETTWDGANSLHLAHWNLSADLGRMVETELKRKAVSKKKKPANTLRKLLDMCFTHAKHPRSLSMLQNNLKHGVVDSPTFDAAFPKHSK